MDTSILPRPLASCLAPYSQNKNHFCQLKHVWFFCHSLTGISSFNPVFPSKFWVIVLLAGANTGSSVKTSIQGPLKDTWNAWRNCSQNKSGFHHCFGKNTSLKWPLSLSFQFVRILNSCFLAHMVQFFSFMLICTTASDQMPWIGWSQLAPFCYYHFPLYSLAVLFWDAHVNLTLMYVNWAELINYPVLSISSCLESVRILFFVKSQTVIV